MSRRESCGNIVARVSMRSGGTRLREVDEEDWEFGVEEADEKKK